jgi:glucosylglycerate synthase
MMVTAGRPSSVLYCRCVIAEIPQRETPSLLGQLEQLGVTFSAGRGTQRLNEVQLVGDDTYALSSWIDDADVVDVDDSLERFSPGEIRRIMLVRQQEGVIHLTCPQTPRRDFEPKTSWDLGDDLVGDLAAAGDFDLVLGLPSYNVASTLRNNIECLAQGAHELGAPLRCLVVVSDSGSKDKSLEDCWTHYGRGVRPTRYSDVYVLALSQRGVRPGKGSSLKTIFEISDRVRAQAVMVMDSDITTAQPGWVSAVISPIIDGSADTVVPMVTRNKYDGRGTNAFSYPLISAFTSNRIRNPLSGVMGFSSPFLKSFLAAQDTWEDVISLYGIESHLSIHMGFGRFSVAQPDLGILQHSPRLFHATFPTFLQVFRSTFKSLWSYRDSWGGNAREREDAPWDSRLEDVPVKAIDLEELSQHIQQGLGGSASHWLEFLGADLAADMTTACARVMEDQNYRFSPALWGDIVLQYLLRFPLFTPLSPQEDEFLVSLMAPFSAFYMSYARHVELLTRAESELAVEKTVEAFSERIQYWVPKIEGRPRAGAGTYLYELG